MSDIFPKWTNRLPLQIAVGTVLVGTAVTAGMWYYFTPKYTRVGYQPIQPVRVNVDYERDPFQLAPIFSHHVERKPAGRRPIKIFDCCHDCHRGAKTMADNGSEGLLTKNAAWSRIMPDRPGSKPRKATRAIAMIPQ